MDPDQSISRQGICPDCGAAISREGHYCWLCGWKLGDPVGVRPKLQGPSKVGRYASPTPPNRGDSKWTFSLSTLFLWTALVAVVMGVVRIEPGLGIAFAVLAIPAALHSAAIAAKRERHSGHALSVPQKIEAFLGSFGLVIFFAGASIIAAFGAFFVTCTVGSVGRAGFVNQDVGQTSTAVAGAVFVGVMAYLLVRNVRRTKD